MRVRVLFLTPSAAPTQELVVPRPARTAHACGQRRVAAPRPAAPPAPARPAPVEPPAAVRLAPSRALITRLASPRPPRGPASTSRRAASRPRLARAQRPAPPTRAEPRHAPAFLARAAAAACTSVRFSRVVLSVRVSEAWGEYLGSKVTSVFSSIWFNFFYFFVFPSIWFNFFYFLKT
jgi:hypothetical protein